MKFLKKRSFYIPAIVLAAILIGFLVFRGGGHDGFETQIVEPKTITHVVSETGRVEPRQDISLSFARGGRVSRILVKKGDAIVGGQTLAFLETGSLNAELRQAVAALELEKASIEKMEISLQNARLELSNALASAYITADDAIQAKADQLFKDPESDHPSFGIEIAVGNEFYFINASTEKSSKINILRKDAEEKMKSLEDRIFGGSITEIEQVSLETEAVLQNIQLLLSSIASALNEYVASDTSAQAVYEDFKTDIYSARSNINATLTSLRTAMQNFYTARVSVLAGGTESGSSTVRLRDIQIEEAQAKIAGIRSNINEAYIFSPLTGLITGIEINEGEVVGVAAPAISVISNDDLEISVNIPEDDIAFVDVGDTARINFDAYDNLIFDGRVIYISPRAEEIDGVPVFEVILQFQANDSRIRAGLSADVDIIAEEKENIISVPSRAVIEDRDSKFVRVMIDDRSFRRQKVTLGLKGDDGQSEVIEGLKTGDRIITLVDNQILKTLKEIE